MILRICSYQILKNKQCSHFLKTIISIVNWLISHVKILVQRKFIFNFQCYQYNDDISCLIDCLIQSVILCLPLKVVEQKSHHFISNYVFIHNDQFK